MNLVPIYAALPDVEFRLTFGQQFMSALRTTIRLDIIRRLDERKFEFQQIAGHAFEIEKDVENLTEDFLAALDHGESEIEAARYELYSQVERYLPETLSIYAEDIDSLIDRIKALA